VDPTPLDHPDGSGSSYYRMGMANLKDLIPAELFEFRLTPTDVQNEHVRASEAKAESCEAAPPASKRRERRESERNESGERRAANGERRKE
jgi:hypothetical protein